MDRVRRSGDDGATWSVFANLWPSYSAYSAMAVLPPGNRLAVLYERGDAGNHYRNITLALIDH